MIKLDNISFSYGKTRIFESFSFDINSGDIICLFGESGCGKTTLLRLILGLEKPQKGKIIKEENLKAAVVFQENLLLPFKTVLENITIMGASPENALYHLKALGVDEYANALPSSLSGGMARRVAIARALSNAFDFIVLDEPFTGLDEDNIKTAAEHILKTVKNKTIILVTHSLTEAEYLNTTIIDM